MRKPYSMHTRRLGGLIALVSIFTSEGPRRILGEIPPPTAEDLCEIARSLASQGPSESVQVSRIAQEPLDVLCAKETYEEILATCGGWETITRAAQQFKHVFPSKWRLFVEFSLMAGAEGPGLRGGVPVIAEKFGITTTTAQKWRDETPLTIAGLALHGSVPIFDEIQRFTS